MRLALGAYGVGVWLTTHPKTSAFLATGLAGLVALPFVILAARKLK